MSSAPPKPAPTGRTGAPPQPPLPAPALPPKLAPAEEEFVRKLIRRELAKWSPPQHPAE